MAAIPTAQAGPRSSTSTWTGGVIPQLGVDTIILNHNLTWDTNGGVGLYPAEGLGETPAIDWGTANVVLTIAEDVDLTVAGNLRFLGNSTVADVFVMQAGSRVLFDMTGAAAPSTTEYAIITQQGGTQRARINIQGTVAKPCTITTVNGVGSWYITRNGSIISGGIRATECDFLHMSDSAGIGFNAYLGNQATDLDFQHCLFDDSGRIEFSTTPSTGVIRFLNCTFRNGRHATHSLSLGTPGSATQRLLTGCVFDKLVGLGAGAWTLDDSYLHQTFSYSASATPWTSAARCLMRNASQAITILGGTLTDSYWLEDHATANPHGMTLNDLFAHDLNGVVFEYTGTSQVGDSAGDSTPSSPKTYNVRRYLVLPNAAGKAMGTGFTFADGDADCVVNFEHCTFCVDEGNPGGIVVGETVQTKAGQIAGIKSCLAWRAQSGTSGTGDGFLLWSFASPGAATDVVLAANVTNNGKWNLRTGSAGVGYDVVTFSSGSPGANDVTGDPGFIDRARNIAAWDASLGGPGTAAHALQEIQKRNDRTGYNPAYAIVNLWNWVRAGYAVTSPSYVGAGHDGADIGAVTMQTLTPAAAVAAATAETPTLQTNAGPQTLAPASAPAAATSPTPTLAASPVMLAVAAGTATATAPTPALAVGAVNLTPAAATAAATAGTPTIVAAGVALVAVGAATGTASVPGPALVAGLVVLGVPAAQAVALAVPPNLIPGSVALAPASAQGSATAPTPNLVPAGAVTMLPASAAALAVALAPSLVAAGLVILALPAASALAQALAPFVAPSVAGPVVAQRTGVTLTNSRTAAEF